jgi:hypothetical protein
MIEPDMKVRIPEEAMKYFKLTGAEGGKARARKHTKAELSEWGKKGGRPRRKPDTESKSKGGK